MCREQALETLIIVKLQPIYCYSCYVTIVVVVVTGNAIA